MDQNVYEGAFWSSVSELSEYSVAQGGMPQVFPDFTRGDWKTTRPAGHRSVKNSFPIRPGAFPPLQRAFRLGRIPRSENRPLQGVPVFYWREQRLQG